MRRTERRLGRREVPYRWGQPLSEFTAALTAASEGLSDACIEMEAHDTYDDDVKIVVTVSGWIT